MSHTEGNDLAGSNSEPARGQLKSAQPHNRPDNQPDWLDLVLDGLAEEYSPLRTGEKRLSKYEARKILTAKIAEERQVVLDNVRACKNHPLLSPKDKRGWNSAIDYAADYAEAELEAALKLEEA